MLDRKGMGLALGAGEHSVHRVAFKTVGHKNNVALWLYPMNWYIQ